ncbi:methionine--tRNA ligase subunit beta, partial [Methanothrix sp.]
SVGDVSSALMEYEFKRASDAVLSLADYANTYFQSHEPWKLIRSDRKAAGSVLRNCLQMAKAMIILMEPFMPSKMAVAWRQLGMGSLDNVRFTDAVQPIPEGHALGTPKILFSRMEDSTVKKLEEIFRERIRRAEGAEEGVEGKPMISFEQFKALDLRAGTVLEAERIKGSDKLLRLIVDIGERRQIVAGIAKVYSPEELVGRQVVVVANLEPVKIFGVESRGMLLAADINGDAVLLRPDRDVPPGSGIR